MKVKFIKKMLAVLCVATISMSCIAGSVGAVKPTSKTNSQINYKQNENNKRLNQLKKDHSIFNKMFAGNQHVDNFLNGKKIKNTCLIHAITNFNNIQNYIDGNPNTIKGCSNVIQNYIDHHGNKDLLGNGLELDDMKNFLKDTNVSARLVNFSGNIDLNKNDILLKEKHMLSQDSLIKEYNDAINRLKNQNKPLSEKKTKLLNKYKKLKKGQINQIKYNVRVDLSKNDQDALKKQVKDLLIKYMSGKSFAPVAILGSNHWILLAQYNAANNEVLVLDSNYDNPQTSTLDEILNNKTNLKVNQRNTNQLLFNYNIAFLTKGGDLLQEVIVGKDSLNENNQNEIIKKVDAYKSQKRTEKLGKMVSDIKEEIEKEQNKLRYQNSRDAMNSFLRLANLKIDIETIEKELKNENFKDNSKLVEYENKINELSAHFIEKIVKEKERKEKERKEKERKEKERKEKERKEKEEKERLEREKREKEEKERLERQKLENDKKKKKIIKKIVKKKVVKKKSLNEPNKNLDNILNQMEVLSNEIQQAEKSKASYITNYNNRKSKICQDINEMRANLEAIKSAFNSNDFNVYQAEVNKTVEQKRAEKLKLKAKMEKDIANLEKQIQDKTFKKADLEKQLNDMLK